MLLRSLLCCLALALATETAHAGAQHYEPLPASVQAALSRTRSAIAPPDRIVVPRFRRGGRLADGDVATPGKAHARTATARIEFLKTVHYEATRAGLDPQLVLGLIQVESGFRKYAVSSAGARGYMQVMPFWLRLIGRRTNNLFHLRTNLRFGCTILRHYLDIEQGDLYRALGRYNGSLGQARVSEYGTRGVGAQLDLPDAVGSALRIYRPHSGQHPLHPAHHLLHAAFRELLHHFLGLLELAEQPIHLLHRNAGAGRDAALARCLEYFGLGALQQGHRVDDAFDAPDRLVLYRPLRLLRACASCAGSLSINADSPPILRIWAICSLKSLRSNPLPFLIFSAKSRAFCSSTLR